MPWNKIVSERKQGEGNRKRNVEPKLKKNLSIILWIAIIFLGFLPGLVFYLSKKDDPYLLSQAKEALNWSITAFILYFIGMILFFCLLPDGRCGHFPGQGLSGPVYVTTDQIKGEHDIRRNYCGRRPCRSFCGRPPGGAFKS